MALPKIDAPIYELTLPLSGKPIRYRPFLVKEQRNLLMAMESDDATVIEQNIRQVLTNCTITPNIDLDSLPLIDIEYFFLQLRARSVGEVVENKYKCNNELEDGQECSNIMDVNFNLLEIKVDKPEGISDTIKLNDTITVKLRYPQFSVVKRATQFDNMADLALELIAESIEYIHDGQQFYYAKESDPVELIEFVESLNTEQFSKVEEFFNNLPSLEKNIEMKCNKCGFEHKIKIEGLENFFG
jgi:hypothetical protein